MSPTILFVFAVVIAGVVTLLAIFAVAIRSGEKATPFTAFEIDRRASGADRVLVHRLVATEPPVATALEQNEVVGKVRKPRSPPRDPVLDRAVVAEQEFAITRRRFFNRAVLAVWGLVLTQFAIAGLAFFWPKLRGGFGRPINVGKPVELKGSIIQGATIVPLFVPAAQAWIVPFEMAKLPGSSYENLPFVVVGGGDDGIGLMALWQRCVHLGCRVPSCVPSQGFECPCHGSKYNLHGEYEAGPAPRNLDRFALSVNEAGDLIVDTGTIVQTARSKMKTVPYPQGPFCV